MARIAFTPQLQRFTTTPVVEVAAATLGEALEAAFALNPQLRGYVLDEQSHVRRHVAVFIDGELQHDRSHLTQAVREDSEIFVMQALSGG